jgi:hypothetical protein
MPDIMSAHANGAPITMRIIMEENMMAVMVRGSKFVIEKALPGYSFGDMPKCVAVSWCAAIGVIGLPAFSGAP